MQAHAVERIEKLCTASDVKQIGKDTEARHSPASRVSWAQAASGYTTSSSIDFCFLSDMMYEQTAEGFTARVMYSCMFAAEYVHSTRQQAGWVWGRGGGGGYLAPA